MVNTKAATAIADIYEWISTCWSKCHYSESIDHSNKSYRKQYFLNIDPAAPLPANRTVTISTEGATDTDMNGFPPPGVYVIISSDMITVTNQPIDVGTAEEGAGGTESGGSDEGTESGVWKYLWVAAQ